MKLNIVKMDQEHRKRKRIHFKVVRFIIESGKYMYYRLILSMNEICMFGYRFLSIFFTNKNNNHKCQL